MDEFHLRQNWPQHPWLPQHIAIEACDLGVSGICPMLFYSYFNIKIYNTLCSYKNVSINIYKFAAVHTHRISTRYEYFDICIESLWTLFSNYRNHDSYKSICIIRIRVVALVRTEYEFSPIGSEKSSLTREHREPGLTDWNASCWVFTVTRLTRDKNDGVISFGPYRPLRGWKLTTKSNWHLYFFAFKYDRQKKMFQTKV